MPGRLEASALHDRRYSGHNYYLGSDILWKEARGCTTYLRTSHRTARVGGGGDVLGQGFGARFWGSGALVKTWLIDASGCDMQSRFDSCICTYVVVCVLSDRD